MAVRFQLVIDCREPEPLARFWVAALRYEFEPPPEGFLTWDDYWRDVGVGEEELGMGQDCIVDPDGSGSNDQNLWIGSRQGGVRKRTFPTKI